MKLSRCEMSLFATNT